MRQYLLFFFKLPRKFAQGEQAIKKLPYKNNNYLEFQKRTERHNKLPPTLF